MEEGREGTKPPVRVTAGPSGRFQAAGVTCPVLSILSLKSVLGLCTYRAQMLWGRSQPTVFCICDENLGARRGQYLEAMGDQTHPLSAADTKAAPRRQL